MKIVNIDVSKELAELFLDQKIPIFINGFVERLEKVFYGGFQDFQDISTKKSSAPIWKFERSRYENIAVLLHTIPVYLREYQGQDGRISDEFGAYISSCGRYTPYIELYLTKILDQAAKDVEKYHSEYNNTQKKKKRNIYFKHLVTKVLLHELAHAALDIFNLEDTPSSEAISYSSEFGKWREESMANAVALRIIRDKSISITDKNTGKKYKDNSGNQLSNNTGIYNYAKTFMEKSQPPEYALGVLMEDFDYEDFNSVFEAKIKGVDKNLQKEWLEYVKSGSPNWEGLKNWNKRLLNHARSNP